MRCALRWRSSCGPSNARATSWRSWTDEGLALFCGLNAMPKKSFLSEYSSRITPQKVARLLALWHDHLAGEAILGGQSLNLDFHSVPYFGEHPLVESHYLSKRSRPQPTSAWRTVNLDISNRKYRTPRVYEQKVCPRKHTFRQFFIKDLGRGRPPCYLIL